jgi:hypothetical protein
VSQVAIVARVTVKEGRCPTAEPGGRRRVIAAERTGPPPRRQLPDLFRRRVAAIASAARSRLRGYWSHG